MTANSSRRKEGFAFRIQREMMRSWDLYLLIIPVLLYYVIFCYYPMYGAQISFRDFRASRGILGSEWVGLEHFQRFFAGAYASRLIGNTIMISLYSLAAGFPLPIFLAVMLNEIGCRWFKKTVQLVTYAPHFLSTVVMVGMLTSFLSKDSGIINQFIRLFHGTPVNFMIEPGMFKTIYVVSGIWQSTGYGSIIYLAALGSIDLSLYEAAVVDGASRWKRIIHITIPCIFPTAITMLILNAGNIMSVGFEKVYLMQNDLNMSASDVISTYVYRSGLQKSDFSFASAVNLFNSIVNFALVMIVNAISRKVSEANLF